VPRVVLVHPVAVVVSRMRAVTKHSPFADAC